MQKINISIKDVSKSFLGFLLVFLLVYSAVWFTGEEQMQLFSQKLGPFAFFGIAFIKALAVIVAPISGSPVYPLAGALLGSWYGELSVLLGDFIGYSTAFYLSRAYGIKIAGMCVGKKNIKTVLYYAQKLNTIKNAIIARIVASGMPELLAYASGFSSMNYTTFILIMMIPQVPIVILMVEFGTYFLSLPPFMLVVYMAAIVAIPLMFVFIALKYKIIDFEKDI